MLLSKKEAEYKANFDKKDNEIEQLKSEIDQNTNLTKKQKLELENLLLQKENFKFNFLE